MDIDGYEIGEIAYLRRGGPLWAAHDRHGRSVLVSFHAPHEGQVNETRWRQWASVTSPHVAALWDVVRHEDGRWALVQERIEGESLALLLANGGVREKVSRHRIYQGICEGVEALHRAGIIHGDLSPHNIIVSPGQRAVIIDLCDDPAALAGTEGWSATENPSKEADIDAVEKIREALLPAEGTGELPDPATRLRLHASLPVTEVRTPSRRSTLLRQRRSKKSRGPRKERRKLSPASFSRSEKAPHFLPASLVVIVSVLVGGGAWAFTMADRSSADGLDMANRQEKTSTQNVEKSRREESPQKEKSQSGVRHKGAHSQREGGVEYCAPDEMAARIAEILRARDEAFNSVQAGALGQYVAGDLLSGDLSTISQMSAQQLRVSGFQTTLKSLSVRRCDEQGAQVELTVSHGEHQRCVSGSCTTMPAGQEAHVILDLEGTDLKGVRAQ